MNEVIFLIVLALVWIVFASVQDLRRREVANWLVFSLIIFALDYRFFHSLFLGNFNFFYQGLIGLGIFFVVGNLFYYSKLFAGGDAKLMIALGAVLPFYESFFANLKIFGFFIFIFLFAGGIYGMVWSFVLSLRNFKKFKKEFAKVFEKSRNQMYLFMAFGIVLMLLGFFETFFIYFGIMVFVFPYLYIHAKAVDESFMVRKTKTSELTEGDWLYENVRVGKKAILAKWGGLEKEEINLLRKNKKFVLVRFGIPFVPVFLMSFLILLLVYFGWFKVWKFI